MDKKKIFVCKQDFSIYNGEELGFKKDGIYWGTHFTRPPRDPAIYHGPFDTGRNGYIIDSGKRKVYFGYEKNLECDEHGAAVHIIESTFYNENSTEYKKAIKLIRKEKLNKIGSNN